MNIKRISINQDILKIIALITMTIDHIAKYFSYGILSDIGRYIGRISFPIFAFLLMEHLYKRQIFKKYIVRLSCFGFLTFLLLYPFHGKLDQNIAIPFNILISFLFAILALASFEWIKKEKAPFLIKIPFLIFNFFCFGFLSLGCEYSIFGFCYLIFIYSYFEKATRLNLFGVLLFSILINLDGYRGIVSLLTPVFLLCLDLDKTYPRLIKHWWSFYIFYPLHLLAIASLSYLLMY